MHPGRTPPADELYTCRRVALLTQHGKQRAMAPLLAEALGLEVCHVTGFDTDRLGTFTREIPRPGSQLDAARSKARLGMELAGLGLGLASEGAFGPDPYTGLLPWNTEVVLFLDAELGIEVVGMAGGPSNFAHCLTGRWDEAAAFAHGADFPAHWLIVRPEGQDDPRIRKGIDNWTAFQEAFHQACREAANGRAFVETDMRAHANPRRMRLIEQAARDLVDKLRAACPACGCPGYRPLRRESGLPCADCGMPTREARADILGCARCGHEERRERPGSGHASPERCDYCNP